MRVLVFEPDYGGHRLHYVHHIVRALLEISQKVVVALSSVAPGSAEFATHLAALDGAVQFDAWIPPLPGGVLRNALHRVKSLRQSITRANADWLFVPGADSISQILGIRRTILLPTFPNGLRAEGLMLRGGFAYPQTNGRQSCIAEASWNAACRAPWAVTHILDPVVYNTMFQRGALSNRYRLMPDPVEIPDSIDQKPARAKLGIPADGRYIGCVGLIDRRKGTDLLISAFAKAVATGALAGQDRLLLAGPQEPEIRQMLCAPMAPLVRQGRIVCIDRTLTINEMLDALVALDLVAVLYQNHIGSASIAIRAAAARRPVLASASGWLKAIVPAFQLGRLCDASDAMTLPYVLADSLREASEYQWSPAIERFVHFHNDANFRAHWTEEIRRHLGLSQSPDYRSWDWVREAPDSEAKFLR